MLNIPASYLDKSKHYSIQSAPDLVKNAVQVTIYLSVIIDNANGTKQKLNQKFLVLRPDLSLTLPLLGSDFLRANNSVIQYDKEGISLVLNNFHVRTISNDEPLQCTNTFLTLPQTAQKTNTKTPTMSQNGKNTFQVKNESSIHFQSSNVSLDTFNSFLLNCRCEKLNSMYSRQGNVVNAHSLAVRDLDQMSAA